MRITHIIESSGGSADFVLYLIKYLPHHQHLVIYGNRTFGKRENEIIETHPKVGFQKWEHVQREVKLLKDFRADAATLADAQRARLAEAFRHSEALKKLYQMA